MRQDLLAAADRLAGRCWTVGEGLGQHGDRERLFTRVARPCGVRGGPLELHDARAVPALDLLDPAQAPPGQSKVVVVADLLAAGDRLLEDTCVLGGGGRG